MTSKNTVFFFRVEPRLEAEIRRRADELDQKPSEFLRDLIRATLGIRPDYAPNPCPDVEIDNSPHNLPYAK
jgi:hypothetical protein